jgi:hypothetical protein
MTNTLAFYENPQLRDNKSFITLGPGRVAHGASTLSIMAIRIRTFSIMTFSLKGLLETTF